MLVTTNAQKRTTPTRAERYNAACNLADAGVNAAAIARTIGTDVRFVERLLSMRTVPARVRNAWLMGLNVTKFKCV